MWTESFFSAPQLKRDSLGSACRTEAVAQMSRKVLDNTELMAKLSLLAMQASAEHKTAPEPAWLVNGAVHSSEQLLDTLRSLPKPLVCQADPDGHQIRLHLRSMTESQERTRFLEFESKSFEGMSHYAIKTFGHDKSKNLIDVRWADASLVVPLPLIRDWFLEYRIEKLVTSLRGPDGRAISSGAMAIIRLGSCRNMVIDVEIR